MEQITKKQIENRFKQLADIVKTQLNIEIEIGHEYNKYCIYESNHLSYFPNSNIFSTQYSLTKREFYEKIDLLYNLMLKITGKFELKRKIDLSKKFGQNVFDYYNSN
jgi:hypothetical protein